MDKESSRRYFEAVQGRGVHKGELFGINNLFRLLTRKILEVRGPARVLPFVGLITVAFSMPKVMF